MPTVAFVCVRNAGRSQIATAYAERERADRDLEGTITLVTGGTDPADAVHAEVVEVMDEAGIDLGDAEPRTITDDDLRGADYAITMGCDLTLPDGFDGVHREWELDDPGESGVDGARETRDEIEALVADLFDELEDKAVDDAGP